MAVHKRTASSTDAGKKQVKRMTKTSVRNSLALPDELSVPAEDFVDYAWLLYGERKIGKTTLCSQMPKAFFMCCEAGTKALSVYQKPVNSWLEFVGYVDLLETTKHDFGTVVVDTVDMAYDLCYSYVCEKLAIEHPSEASWGGGWKMIKDELNSALMRLMKLEGVGCVFISHSKEKEIKRRNGSVSTVICTTLPSMAKEIVEGLVDIIAYYQYDENGQRVLQVKGDDLVVAGCRVEHVFEKTQIIPMGDSKETAYENLYKAWKNEEIVLSKKKEASASVEAVKRTTTKKKVVRKIR